MPARGPVKIGGAAWHPAFAFAMSTTTEIEKNQEFQTETLLKSEQSHATDKADLWQSLTARLSPETLHAMLEFLARSAPTRELWKLLGQNEHLLLQLRLTKGFQRTAGALRQTPVRNRLVHEMNNSFALTALLLDLWTETMPTVLSSTREFADDEALLGQIPQLWKRFSTEALFWSLLAEGREDVLDGWIEQLANGATAPGEDETEASEPAGDKALTEVASPALEKSLNEARQSAAKWQTRAENAETKLRAAATALTSERAEHSKQAHDLRAQARQEENRYVAAHEKLVESEKNLDRTTRKLKSTEKHFEELETDNKRLKKQVRQQQELNEELKKEAAGVRAKIEALESASEVAPTPDSTPSSPATTPSTVLRFYPAAPTVAPQEQQFIWDADGHTIRVTPRDIKRAVDRNDENFVFALIQAMDALRQTSAEGFKLLIERLNDYDRYYAQVLTKHTTRILVDASNVARYEKNRFGKGQIRFLLAMRQELRRRNCFPIRFIADASLPYNIDSPEELLAMAKRSELELSVAGQEADEILAREARRSGAFVVSNDRTFHHKVSPGFEPPRVGFQFYDAYVVVDEF